MAEENAEHQESGDYTRFGIPNAPKTTFTSPFGKTKTCAGLLGREKWFLILSFINIVTAVSLTTYRLVVVVQDETLRQSSDFTFTILIIVNSAFVAFYALHGVFRERKYELYVQVLAILIILLYCIVEYAIQTDRRNDVKLVRLIVACVVSPPNIVLAVLVARNFGELEFRIAGASQHLQYIYNQAAIFSCWLKFDLQVTVSLVILVLKSVSHISTLETVTLSVGIPYTIIWVLLGWFTLRLELRWGAIVFGLLGLAKPSYYIFKFVKLYQDLEEYDGNENIYYCVIIAGALAILSWLILMVELRFIYKNFGQGLKDTEGHQDGGTTASSAPYSLGLAQNSVI